MFFVLLELTKDNQHLFELDWYMICSVLFATCYIAAYIAMVLSVIVENWWAMVNEHKIMFNQATVSRQISYYALLTLLPGVADDRHGVQNVNFTFIGFMFVAFVSVVWPALVIMWLWFGSISLGRFIRRMHKRVNHLETNK